MCSPGFSQPSRSPNDASARACPFRRTRARIVCGGGASDRGTRCIGEGHPVFPDRQLVPTTLCMPGQHSANMPGRDVRSDDLQWLLSPAVARLPASLPITPSSCPSLRVINGRRQPTRSHWLADSRHSRGRHWRAITNGAQEPPAAPQREPARLHRGWTVTRRSRSTGECLSNPEGDMVAEPRACYIARAIARRLEGYVERDLCPDFSCSAQNFSASLGTGTRGRRFVDPPEVRESLRALREHVILGCRGSCRLCRPAAAPIETSNRPWSQSRVLLGDLADCRQYMLETMAEHSSGHPRPNQAYLETRTAGRT